jgi:hypothetical protein
MKTGALLLAVAGCGIAAVTVAVAADPQKPKAATAAAATSAASPTTLVYYFHDRGLRARDGREPFRHRHRGAPPRVADSERG